MRLGACQCEKDVAELVKRGQWPGLASAELRAHVAECAACRDLVAVTEAFQRERVVASAEVRLEAPGVLWWRAQLRKRNAVLRQVGRPLVAAHVFAVVLGAVAAVLCFVFAARYGTDWMGLVTGLPSALHIQEMLPVEWQNTQAPWVVLLTIVVAGLMGGVVVYRASEDR